MSVITLRGRDYPVVLPTLRDPRVHLAAVIVSLQVLGQTVLGFEVSVAQILVSVATCAVLEILLTWRRRRILLWPASALLTGNGIAFILRVPGTRHGDWWSLRGAGIFAAVAAASMLSKYVIRIGGRHVFNPSNIGLVACFLLLGTRRVNPQDLWWGHLSPGLAFTYAIIGIAGLSIVWRMRMVGLAAAFWVTFTAGTAVTAAAGHCMTARWHIGPVCGQSYWWVLVTSPEILVFLFFMITDPRTTPGRRSARVVFGTGVGLLAALLAAPARSEFGTKLAVLSALALVCAARPVAERVLRDPTAARRRLAGRPIAVSAAGVAFAAVLAIVLVWMGRPTRSQPSLPLVVRRPDVPVDPAAVPPVTISAAVRAADGGLTAPGTRQMALDLVADLVIEGRAVAHRDPALAATAATAGALQALRERMAAAGSASGPVSGTAAFVPRVDRLTALVVRDPANPQSPPQIGLLATGPGINRTFVLTFAGGHWLIASDTPAGA